MSSGSEPSGGGHRLVRDGRRTGGKQSLGLSLVGGEVQVSEQDLTGAQHLALGELGFLDLDDELGGGEHIPGLRGDLGPGGLVM